MTAYPITTTGYWAHATTTGNRAHATTTGYWAHATTTGGWAHAATTGYWAHATTTGNRAHAATTGYWAHATTTGGWANAIAAQGAAESAHAVAVGRWVRLWPDSCDALVLPSDSNKYHPYLVAVSDGWTVGRWITMVDGWVIERPDVLLPDDGRGYQLTYTNGTYRARCRKFITAKAAIKHWENPNHQAPHSARLLATEVRRHAGLLR